MVLRDPNVSPPPTLRYDGRHWHIADLRSTNGTLVNDIDVDEIILHDGNLITVGLVNLEFRELMIDLVFAGRVLLVILLSCFSLRLCARELIGARTA